MTLEDIFRGILCETGDSAKDLSIKKEGKDESERRKAQEWE
jgi:hypothetical protein